MEPIHTRKFTRKKLIDRAFAYLQKLPASDSFILRIILIALFVSGALFLVTKSAETRVEIATSGGSFTEGIVGTPRFVNPVLAVSRADRDLVALVYDGLLSLGSAGSLEPNIAESVTVSDDGLTYNIVLRHDATFHDGKTVTARDVLFTVGRIQDPALASPLRSAFEGVTVEQVGDFELNFILQEPYAPFIENLTFGILPEHLWKDASNEEFPFSQLNTEPIGAGPYAVSKIIRNTSGIPQTYILKPNKNYHRTTPKIDTLKLQFVSNEDALIKLFKEGAIDALAGIDPSKLTSLNLDSKTHTVIALPLPRTFALFFNQNKNPVLRDIAVRKALNEAIDRNTLIQAVLGGYGRPLTSPIPQGFGYEAPVETQSTTSIQDTGLSRIGRASAILTGAGWKRNATTGEWEKTIDGTLTPLSFSISTLNSPIFQQTAEYVRAAFAELGVMVTVKQFEQSDLTQSIIRPRDYESLLFGTQVGRSFDFYPFWHSSQRNDPGLNVSLYANLSTDSVLNESRKKTNSEDRNAALTRFVTEVNKEVPAIFLYSPELLYIFPKNVAGTSFTGIGEQFERFASIRNWYINTESVWPLFKKEDTGT